jgi:succinate-acetate transporter protein
MRADEAALRRISKSRFTGAILRTPGVFRLSVLARGMKMRQITACLAICVCLAMLPTVGNAKGCLKGAAVGGVVGHVAGHHAVLGAAAGCVIEHHREKVKDKAAAQNAQAQNRPAANDAAHNGDRNDAK